MNLRVHIHESTYSNTRRAMLGIKANTEMGLLVPTGGKWRQFNIQLARKDLTIPMCFDKINFASHEQLRTVHAFPHRKVRGFSSQADGEIREVKDPEATKE